MNLTSVFFSVAMDQNNSTLAAFSTVLLSIAAVKLQAKRASRRFKVRPINKGRKKHGNFQYYLKMKRLDPDQFFKYTRMTEVVFNKLLSFLKPKIQKQSRSDEISAEERLVITLQYLSQGSSMQSLAWTFQIGHTTVHKIIHETCKAIWEVLAPLYLKTPEVRDEWLEIAKSFEETWHFPNCIGAIDGKHIKIQAPSRSGSLFYNYKHDFSIVLLASCDARYRFTMVDIGAYGSQSDGGIFRNSVFGQSLENSKLNIPESRILPGTTTEMPYFLVGDEAFPLKNYIMRPYPGKKLTNQQKIFNYRLSRARQVIENTFGLVTARWRILKTHINAKVENIDNMIKAIVVLHNFSITEHGIPNNVYCPPGFVDSEDEENGAWRNEVNPLQSVGRLGANMSKRALYGLRDSLADYFLASGAVSWQNERILARRLN